MLKGKILNSSSTVGIIAPSSPEDRDIIDEKIESFKAATGFKVKLAPHIYDIYGYLAGIDIDRANDLNNMFKDPEIDGIICLRGGYGAIRMMPYIDKKIIKKNPKFFCGFSDITLLLNYFSKLGLITFHGPMITRDFNDKITLESFLNISSCKSKNYTYKLDKFDSISYINKNSFKGKIAGGNLTMICSAINTPFDIITNNHILLIEEVSESPYAIDRMLTQLLSSGKLKKCKGIILGTFTNCDLNNYSKSLTLEQIFIDRLKPLNIPIILNVPFGHSYPNITIPIGCNASFSSESDSLSFTENFLT